MVFEHYLKHRKEAYEKMTHMLTSEIKSPNVHHYQFAPPEDTRSVTHSSHLAVWWGHTLVLAKGLGIN